MRGVSSRGPFGVILASQIRALQTGNVTIYVRKDGSDSNDGSADDAAHALLTISAAHTLFKKFWDMMGYNLIIQVGPGTYDEGVSISFNNTLGGRTITFRGDPTTPSNVLWKRTTAGSILGTTEGISSEIDLVIDGFRVQGAGTGSSSNFSFGYGGRISLGAIEFVSSPGRHVYMVDYVVLRFTAPWKILGNATSWLWISDACQVVFEAGATCTVENTPAWSVVGFYAYGRCVLRNKNATLITGAATGKKYDFRDNCMVSMGDGGACFPGNSAGTITGSAVLV